MDRRFKSFVLLLVTAVLTVISALPATAQEVARKDTLIVGWEGSPATAPENFNPYGNGAVNFNHGMSVIVESLFYLNYESGEMMPWLAESYNYAADFSGVTVKLRQGIMWSDGEAFTADDVAFTINLLKRDGITFNYSGDMRRWVKEVKAADAQTVEIIFTNPNPRFLLDFFSVHIYGMVVILPEHVWSQQADPAAFTNFDAAKGWPVFTGPYRVVKSSQNEVIYDLREDWWAAKTGFHPLPAPKRVIFTAQGPVDVAGARLQNNELDASHRISADVFDSIKKNNDKLGAWQSAAPWGWIDPCPRTYFFNTLRPPFDNVNVRKAISLAVDRQVLAAAELGLEPGGPPAAFTFPAYPPLMSILDDNKDLLEQYNPTEFNPEKAIALLEGEGYKRGADGIFEKDGKKLSLELLGLAEWVPGPLTFPLFEQYWKNIGIDARGNLAASSVLSERRSNGDFDLALFSPCGSVVDPYRTLDLYSGRYFKPIPEVVSANIARWNNADYTKLTDEIAMLAPGDAKIKPLFRQAFEIWLKEQPAMPVYQQARVVPHNATYWTNWPSAENNYIHPPTWWGTTLIQIIKLKPAQ